MKLGFIFAGALSLLLCGCQGYKYQEDNLVEELVESGIKFKTGADVDFSPSTPESGFSPTTIKPLVKEESGKL